MTVRQFVTGSGTVALADAPASAAGSTCTGSLAPRGSGTSAVPISLTSYGTGALPVIDGNGAASAVTLTNQDHWRISNRKLTNPASPSPVAPVYGSRPPTARRTAVSTSVISS
ncbi:hypothetical protein ACF06X_14360 [Streptomyces sp. NPDC015346]|uniref:hypothetical protein n=1 Tax=Streptomyces sp. NPDC015346 TaxID=3364954 RepID=UPI0036F60A9B